MSLQNCRPPTIQDLGQGPEPRAIGETWFWQSRFADEPPWRGRGGTKNRERTLQIVQMNELLRFGYRFSFDVLSMRVEENKHQQDIFQMSAVKNVFTREAVSPLKQRFTANVFGIFCWKCRQSGDHLPQCPPGGRLKQNPMATVGSSNSSLWTRRSWGKVWNSCQIPDRKSSLGEKKNVSK